MFTLIKGKIMATLPDIIIPSEDWVSIHALTSQPIGTCIKVTLKSSSPVTLQETPTKPDQDTNDGLPLLNIGSSNCFSILIEEGSGEVWAKTSRGTSRLSVEV